MGNFLKITKTVAAIAAPFVFSNMLSAFDVIAHRGENSQAPQNSLEAQSLAWKNGAKFVECDIYFTKARQFVCVHCRTYLRLLSGVDTQIEDLTPEQVSNANLAASKDWKDKYERVALPQMRDVFKNIPKGKVLVLEIKNFAPEFAGEIERLRKECNLEKSQIVIISFKKEALKDFNAKNSGYETLLLATVKSKDGKLSPSAEALIKQARAVGATGVDLGGFENLNAEYVTKVKQAGLKFWVWTVNDEKEVERLAGIGVDGITTDKSFHFVKK